jgi:hypothetical protein
MMSTSATQGVVLLQAMTFGILIVAANSRALPDFVSPANGVLVGRTARLGWRKLWGSFGGAQPATRPRRRKPPIDLWRAA